MSIFIRAKKGTKEEGIFKEYLSESNANYNLAFDIIEKHVGIRPHTLTYYKFIFGETLILPLDRIEFKEEPKVTFLKENEDKTYSINRRFKGAKDLANEFYHQNFRLLPNELESIGVKTLDDTGHYYGWQPFKTADDYYWMSFSSSRVLKYTSQNPNLEMLNRPDNMQIPDWNL